MSFFWSSWITIFSVGCWLFILGVLVYTLRYRPILEEDETTGHSYDGIREYDNPLPKWWLLVFFGTLVWSIGYFAFYPSLQPANLKGIATVTVDGKEQPWTSAGELMQDLQDNNAQFVKSFNAILDNAGAGDAKAVLADLDTLQIQKRDAQKAGQEIPADLQTKIDDQVKLLAPYIDKLAADPNAAQVGFRLFQQNCALCHGLSGEGGLGYPNLTDNDWLYGGESENVLISIHNGRVGGMQAWQQQLGESGVRAAAEYVLSLSDNHGFGVDNGALDESLVAQGKPIFEQNCVLCHGPDAKGLTAMGAPNLTDGIWLFGGDRASVRETVRHGRAGVMPAWQTRLGNERITLLAAYVKSLSQSQE